MKNLEDTNARILTALTHVKAIDKKWKRHYTSVFRPCAQMGLACVSRWNLIKSSRISSENLTFAEHLRHWEQKSCSRYIVVLWSLGLNQSGQFKATFYTSSFVQFNLSEPIEKQKEVTPWPKSTLARFQ